MISIETGDLLIQKKAHLLYPQGTIIYVCENLGHLFGKDKGIYFDVRFYPWNKKGTIGTDALSYEEYRHVPRKKP